MAERNIAFRGSVEKPGLKDNGNFLGLLDLLSKHDPVINEHLKRFSSGTNAHYLTGTMQNEFISLLSKQVSTEIIKRCQIAKYYSVILDCTPDCSHIEQMSIVIRYVSNIDGKLVIDERFLEFVNVSDTTGEGLFNVLLERLKYYNLDTANCRGQCFDNGSNMKGKHKGVQSRLRQINSAALFLPCCNHSLNLVVCDAVNCTIVSKNFFGNIQRIYCFFAGSTKRWNIFSKHMKSLTLKPLCNTRWEAQIKAIKALYNELGAINDSLNEIQQIPDIDATTCSEANSLSNCINFEFIFCVVVWKDILTEVNRVSKTMQLKKQTFFDILALITNIIIYLRQLRENGFELKVEEASKIAREYGFTSEFRQHRIRKHKLMAGELASDNVQENPSQEIKINFFNAVIDQSIVSLNERFDTLESITKIYGFLFDIKLSAAADNLLEMCIRLCDVIGDIDAMDLQRDIVMLTTLLPDTDYNPETLLAYMYAGQRHLAFPSLALALQIFLTLPTTVATAERTFSKLKLTKTYLRSCMNQDRLTNLSILSIENDLAHNINFDSVIDEFADKKARRINLL